MELDKSISKTIYENKIQAGLKNVKGITKKRSTMKLEEDDDVIFNALNNAANQHFSKSVGKPNFAQKKVIEMQKKYIQDVEKQFKIPEKIHNQRIINQKKADELFKRECRSRDRDVSRSPTATFHNTKSSRWIQNFTSLVSEDENQYNDDKVSQRKDLGN